MIYLADRYKSGFTLNFCYCAFCSFEQDAKDGREYFGEFVLKEDFTVALERKHDNFYKHCKTRKLIISFNRALIENVS